MSTPLLHLLHLASPALPIGGFHFSQGLECAVERGWINDESSALDWVEGLARYSIGTLDLPILARLHASWASCDLSQVSYWNDRLVASRETAELRAEERHLAGALARILIDLGRADASIKEYGAFGSIFALACVRSRASALETLSTYLWIWAENQTLAAVKLVPLGQSAGQRILHSLLPHLERIALAALDLDDASIGASAMMQFFASAHHETQYTRLFRS